LGIKKAPVSSQGSNPQKQELLLNRGSPLCTKYSTPEGKDKERVVLTTKGGPYMVTHITTTDAWEASWLLLKGCELEEIEAVKTNDRIICRMILKGENISRLQLTYLNGEAQAGILNLRSMVGQVNAWMYAAKKQFKSRLQEQATGEGGAV